MNGDVVSIENKFIPASCVTSLPFLVTTIREISGGLTGERSTVTFSIVEPRNHHPLGIKTKSPGPQVPSCHDRVQLVAENG